MARRSEDVSGRALRRCVGFVAFLAATVSCSGGGDVSQSTDPPSPGSGEPFRSFYADHDDGFGDLWLPDTDRSVPVVVLIHGGFWRAGFGLDLMDPLVPSLLDEGWAVWNIEYRRVGAGGGFPETFLDVADAVDHLADLPEPAADLIDTGRVAAVGHSAGGHLAAWVAARPVLASGEVGSDPVVVPDVAVAQAGVLDLVGCANDGVGNGACTDLLGATPPDEPERYATTSPTEMVPFDAEVVAVHGDLDRIVPLAQSTTFTEVASVAAMSVEYVEISGADHFAHLDPSSPAWGAVLRSLDSRI